MELQLNAVTDEATLAGWKVDTLKMSVAAGERKPIRVSLSVPEVPHSASAAAFGLEEYVTVTLNGVATGGSPAAPAGGRLYAIAVRALVRPEKDPVSEVARASATSGKGSGAKATAPQKGAKKS